MRLTCALCHEFGSEGDAVGDAAFDDGDGLTSAFNGGLLAGVLGDVECRGMGCGLSGILFFLDFSSISNNWTKSLLTQYVTDYNNKHEQQNMLSRSTVDLDFQILKITFFFLQQTVSLLFSHGQFVECN